MRTILDNCNDILRDIGEPDKVFIYVQEIKGILYREQEPDDLYSQCEECGQFYIDWKGYDFCPNCGKKLEVEK